VAFHGYQSIVLQAGKSTRNYIPDRTYANSNFMVRQREVKCNSIRHRRAIELRSAQQEKRESLSDFMEAQTFH
jgi:hypothetical protein